MSEYMSFCLLINYEVNKKNYSRRKHTIYERVFPYSYTIIIISSSYTSKTVAKIDEIVIIVVVIKYSDYVEALQPSLSAANVS